ncbi:BREX-5 system adenine-specific DNA-methyltransferase PglX [Halobacterium salinarum]|uniref:BREX-5 system adenine-specific DNA-methyltransferase PglX n=1 Tax=Halobacterium salinarum TaxID=2242 RepID=UPI0025549F0A|nr:BREX-5 system adenine-specific DNA-methyltransferase PglX [Halobacterium salinarum]MDL0125897.1 BREX-5 system adenine-specific DNA-methyltransferase PglX [Halobacterium salinarum]
MTSDSLSQRKAQLDKEEREHLEDIVTEMRERVEDNVEFHLTQKGLNDEPDDISSLDEDTQQLVEAIELEAVDGESWSEASDQYVTSVGYTIVNRLAALRCMEVRDFIDEEVTVFKENGLTPAAETLVHEEFLLEDEAILKAYHNACDELAEEIQILFDRSSAYSLIDPDDGTFEELCGLLDEVPDDVWRADDVLGWVYEYYNASKLEELRRKGDYEGLTPEEVTAANQFYTPHWVVRMLTDNSLGRLYLEQQELVEEMVESQSVLSPEERKERPTAIDESPDVSDLCTYLVPTRESGNAPSFEKPSELRVIDPACGSGHFLLYAFDVLERIWRNERPDLDPSKIPRKILKHNLYGVDLDMRACQLTAFNLYLKARERAEKEGASSFTMPQIGVVCADAKIANFEGVSQLFDQIAGTDSSLRDTLEELLEQFEDTHGLGSLLDVRGTLSEEFVKGSQLTLQGAVEGPNSLKQLLETLSEEVDENETNQQFLIEDLRSFLHLLVVLSQKYDVALMNPPYGSGNRMPDSVHDYVDERYEYKAEYYINFFEACERLVRDYGRIGMIVPRTFMFKQSFQDFREDFVGNRGSFDFLAEYGIGVLDKATVRTAGTVVRVNEEQDSTADFYRLHDVEKGEKEWKFVDAAFGTDGTDEVQRWYQQDVSQFAVVPGTPLSYWVPDSIREIYETTEFFDADNAGVDADSLGAVKQGLATADNARFLRRFWETDGLDGWVPFAKGGSDAWILPRVTRMVWWDDAGTEAKRYHGSRFQNSDYYFSEGLTYTNIKEGGKRFGYLHEDSIFGVAGQAFLPKKAVWEVLAYSNSNLVTYLVLALTTGRHWQVGEVSRIPWDQGLEDSEELIESARMILGLLLGKRKHDLISPYYVGPLLLAPLGYQNNLFAAEHPHRSLADTVQVPSCEQDLTTSTSIDELAAAAVQFENRVDKAIQEHAKTIEQHLFSHFNIPAEQQEEIYREIKIRTNENPFDDFTEKQSGTPGRQRTEELVKDVLLHLSIEVVREDADGIVPITSINAESTLLNRIIQKFEDLFGADAQERLAEIDHLLGNKSAENIAYPNLQSWLEESLFEYQVTRFENSPVLWKLTTERLVADPVGSGFTCLVDFNSVDKRLFDALTNRYLEPRKAELRERRSASERRRSDESLSASQQAAAAEEYDRCVSGLQQIEQFEEVMQDLAQPQPRDWSDSAQSQAENLEGLVRRFRNKTQRRLETIDQLRKQEDKDWFEETFSPTFLETVDENREEWLSALETLEQACDAYSQPGDTPVSPHLYDLFTYVDSLIGSGHYSSNGTLFMTYYFDREGSDFVSNGSVRDSIGDRQTQLLGKLAVELDEYVDLAEKIQQESKELSREIPSEWSDRALNEIMVDGYTPKQKHGVAINLVPLSDAEIVPEVVDEKVL